MFRGFALDLLQLFSFSRGTCSWSCVPFRSQDPGIAWPDVLEATASACTLLCCCHPPRVDRTVGGCTPSREGCQGEDIGVYTELGCAAGGSTCVHGATTEYRIQGGDILWAGGSGARPPHHVPAQNAWESEYPKFGPGLVVATKSHLSRKEGRTYFT